MLESKSISTFARRVSLARIDALVSARLGPARVSGNAQPAAFNRQIEIYLAKRVGGWSTTAIGRFYNGRDHSTVCYAIQRIEALRERDPEVEALITELRQQLAGEHNEAGSSEDFFKKLKSISDSKLSIDEFAKLVSERVCAYLEKRTQHQS